MLFRMKYIKEDPITEKGLLQWLLKAKRECLPQELQNRNVFPDVESIVRNKEFVYGLLICWKNFDPVDCLVGE